MKGRSNDKEIFKLIIKSRLDINDKIELKEIVNLNTNDIQCIADLQRHFFAGESAAAFYYNSYIISLLKEESKESSFLGEIEDLIFKCNIIEYFSFVIDFTRLLIWLDKETKRSNTYSEEIFDYMLIDFSNFDEKEKKEILKSYLNDITKNDSVKVITDNLEMIEQNSESLYSFDSFKLWEVYELIYQLAKDNKEVFKDWNSFKSERESRRCVAYFNSGLRQYVSFSGAAVNYVGNMIKKWGDRYREIKQIIDNNIFSKEHVVFCDLKDDCLRFFELDGSTKLSQPIKLSDNYDPNSKNKLSPAFSCCERKIISYLRDGEKLINGIIRYKPCNKCVPALVHFNNLEIQVPDIDVYEDCKFCRCSLYKNSVSRYKVIEGRLKKV